MTSSKQTTVEIYLYNYNMIFVREKIYYKTKQIDKINEIVNFFKSYSKSRGYYTYKVNFNNLKNEWNSFSFLI